jgi:hypothetical protein
MDPTIIHIVGLAVFTTQLVSGTPTARTTIQAQHAVDTQQQVVVILPNVPGRPGPNPNLKKRAASDDLAANQVTIPDITTVETHTAIIAYDNHAQVGPIQGWTASALDNNGWSYIKLTGEHLRFVSDMPDVPLTSTEGLRLPHIGNTPLLSQYTPQGGYSGAAAIITIGSGTLSTCRGAAATNAGRLDSTLTLQVRHVLTITTDSGDKSLKLSAGSQAIIADIPLGFAQGLESSVGHDHFLVYCAMVGEAPCHWPASPARLAVTQQTPVIPDCDVHFTIPTVGQRFLPKIFSAGDFACSNTQWP